MDLKKNVLPILFFFVFVNILFASEKTVKVGINFSSFRNSDAQSIVNYAFAISKSKKINGNFYFLPELLFGGQGSLLKNKPVKNEDWPWYLSAYDIKVLQYYLEVPLLIGYRIAVADHNFFIYLGPSFHAAITDRTTLSNERIIYDDDHPAQKDDFQNYDFEFVQGDYEGHFLEAAGLSLNVGLAVPLSVKFSFEVRYSYALNKLGSVGQLHPLDRKLQALILLLGYRF